jgi:hypothetical protein
MRFWTNGTVPVEKHVTIRPIFAWYDMWIGIFIDRARRRIYVFPFPCLGVVITYGHAKK